MNQFKIWQYSLIASVLFMGVIFALPNIFPSKPALQIALGNSSDEINSNLISDIEKTLNEEGILVGSLELEDNSLTIVLESVDDQLSSRRILSNFSDGDYIIALKSEPSTPKWLREIGAKPLNLGLDLAGGIHFLLEVDTARYSEERLSSEGASLVEEFTKQGIFSSYQSTGNMIDLSFNSETDADSAIKYVNENNFTTSGSKYNVTVDGTNIKLQYTDNYLSEIIDYAVEQNLVALRNRVNELGVSEPIVQREGKGRIVVELPGVQDSASAKKIIGKTANLEFRLEARNSDSFLRKE